MKKIYIFIFVFLSFLSLQSSANIARRCLNYTALSGSTVFELYFLITCKDVKKDDLVGYSISIGVNGVGIVNSYLDSTNHIVLNWIDMVGSLGLLGMLFLANKEKTEETEVTKIVFFAYKAINVLRILLCCGRLFGYPDILT
jgi:hypothetical protein